MATKRTHSNFFRKTKYSGLLIGLTALAAAVGCSDLQGADAALAADVLQNTDSVTGEITVQLEDGTTTTFNLADANVEQLQAFAGSSIPQIGAAVEFELDGVHSIASISPPPSTEDVDANTAHGVTGVVSSVDPVAHTITLANNDGTMSTFSVVSSTEFGNGGITAFAAIQPGAEIEVEFNPLTMEAFEVGIDNSLDLDETDEIDEPDFDEIELEHDDDIDEPDFDEDEVEDDEESDDLDIDDDSTDDSGEIDDDDVTDNSGHNDHEGEIDNSGPGNHEDEVDNSGPGNHEDDVDNSGSGNHEDEVDNSGSGNHEDEVDSSDDSDDVDIDDDSDIDELDVDDDSDVDEPDVDEPDVDEPDVDEPDVDEPDVDELDVDDDSDVDEPDVDEPDVDEPDVDDDSDDDEA